MSNNTHHNAMEEAFAAAGFVAQEDAAAPEAGDTIDETGGATDETGDTIDEAGDTIDETGGATDEAGGTIDEPVPFVGQLWSGAEIVAELRDSKTKKPYGFKVKWGKWSGRIKFAEMFSRGLKKGAAIDVQVTGLDPFDPQNVKIELSEKAAVLKRLVDETADGRNSISGVVKAVHSAGLILSIPGIAGFSAFCHVSEIDGYHPAMRDHEKKELLAAFEPDALFNFCVRNFSKEKKYNERLKKDVWVWAVRASQAVITRSFIVDAEEGVETTAEAVATHRGDFVMKAWVSGREVFAFLSRDEAELKRGDRRRIVLRVRGSRVVAHVADAKERLSREQAATRARDNRAKRTGPVKGPTGQKSGKGKQK